MIRLAFNNWTLSARATSPAMRGDDGTVDVVVSGIPAGWEWELLIRRNGADIATTPMVGQDSALATTLTAEQLAYDGYYTMQLKATRGEMVKHSGAVNVKIGSTISGDDHWPEIPTAFTQALNRAEAAIADAQEVRTAVAASESAAAQSAGDAAGSATAAAQSATTAAGSAESASQSATSAAESATDATESATSAAQSATAAEAAVAHYPRISATTGNWEVWDAATGAWTDTGVHAESPVQDVKIDGQSVLADGVAGISSGAVTKSGMTGNSPAWTQSEQLAARQRIGLEKDWTLVGTIAGDETDRGNIDTGVNVNLAGFTELYFIGSCLTTTDTEFANNKQNMIYACFTSSRKFTAARFVETQFGYDCQFVKYSTVYDIQFANNNGNGYCDYSGIKFAEINRLYLTSPSGVTKCDIKIYAR